MEDYLGKNQRQGVTGPGADSQTERHQDAPLRDRQATADVVLERRDGRAGGRGARSSAPACISTDVDFLAAATAQSDHPLPGFASMVHAEMGSPPCEIATLHGVCASGVMALKTASLHVGSGKQAAVACASEFASRLFKASRFEAPAAGRERIAGIRRRVSSLDALGRLRGRGAPQRARTWTGSASLVDWIELKSCANRFEPCMYVGPAKNGGPLHRGSTIPSYHAAADAGAINLRQDVRMLGDVLRHCVQGRGGTGRARKSESRPARLAGRALLLAGLSR